MPSHHPPRPLQVVREPTRSGAQPLDHFATQFVTDRPPVDRRVDIVTLLEAVRRLPPVPNPAVVFAQFAQLIVPAVCDAAAATIVTPNQMTHGQEAAVAVDRAVVDGATGAANSTRLRPRMLGSNTSPDFTAVIPIAGQAFTAAGAEPGAYTVELSCSWWDAAPIVADVALIQFLGQCAADVVTRSREQSAAASLRRQVDNLQVALTNSRTIGAAIGILMRGRQLTYDQAFQLLTISSQRNNRTVVDLSAEVLYTGDLDA